MDSSPKIRSILKPIAINQQHHFQMMLLLRVRGIDQGISKFTKLNI